MYFVQYICGMLLHAWKLFAITPFEIYSFPKLIQTQIVMVLDIGEFKISFLVFSNVCNDSIKLRTISVLHEILYTNGRLYWVIQSKLYALVVFSWMVIDVEKRWFRMQFFLVFDFSLINGFGLLERSENFSIECKIDLIYLFCFATILVGIEFLNLLQATQYNVLL